MASEASSLCVETPGLGGGFRQGQVAPVNKKTSPGSSSPP